MIIDCFTFFDELDLLEVRLHELAQTVDVFVLTESPWTFTGNEKPLYFDKNKDRFREFNILHSIYRPTTRCRPEEYEKRQKQENINYAFFNCFSLGDIIIQGDVDEIPRAEILERAVMAPWETALFSMDLFYYWLNCKEVTPGRVYRNSLLYRPTGAYVYNAKQNSPVDIVYAQSGWHFSWMGDVKKKLVAWGHANDYDKSPYNTLEHIQKCKEEGKDLFEREGRREMKFEFLPDLTHLPQYIQDNPRRFEKWIKR